MKSLDRILRKTVCAATMACITFFLCTNSARSDDLYVWAEEIGGSVVFHYAGSIDLTGLPVPVPAGVGSSIDPSDGDYFSSGAAGMVAVDAYVGVLPGSPTRTFGAGGATAATSSTGDAFAFANENLGVPVGYISGSKISGSMTFSPATFASLGVSPTPKSYNFLVGDNTMHYFIIPPAVPDLQIGKSFSKLKGDDIYDAGKPSGPQTQRIKGDGKYVARVLMENDGATEKKMTLRSKGDRKAKVRAKAQLPAGGTENISASIKTGAFSPALPAGQAAQVTYRLKTLGGVSSRPPAKVRFVLSAEGTTDNVMMKPKSL